LKETGMICKGKIVCLKTFSIFLLMGCFSFITNAQTGKYSTTSKAAIQNYEEALQKYNAKMYDKAIADLHSAIRKDSTFYEAHVLLASVYEEAQKPKEAIASYNKSFEVSPESFPYNYFVCAKLEVRNCMYAEAEKHFEKYLTYPNIDPRRKAEINIYLETCRYAVEAMKHPVPFNPVNMGEGVNSKYPEYYFSFTLDQQNLIFTRHAPDSKSKFGHSEDFFVSKLSEGKWQLAKQLDPPLNTGENEGAPSMSVDGRVVFFTACNRNDGQGACDIYLSGYSDDNKWSKPVNIGPPVNTPVWESQPSFASDGKTLYFSRRVTKDGRDNTDLFYSVFQDDYTWSTPVSLGNVINTNGMDESVFIHPDNQTLYFSSDGHPGMGGLDIYMSRRKEDGSWGTPVNLGYPINTCDDEKGLVVSADGQKAYFASDRPGGFGNLDLYVFDLYKEAQPVLTSYVKAKVTDASTTLPLAAQFEIVDVETGKVVVKNTTDKMRGEFMAVLPSGKNYLLNVSKEGYLFYSENFECKNVTDKQKVYLLNVPMQKITAGASVVLKNIFFDVDKYDLKPESQVELEKLLSFLNGNAAVKIEIGGHTDSTGDKIKNQKLSENRAKAVLDYLLSKGIHASRLSSKGYGDTQPVADNKTEEGRAANRRTVFKIK
jgi:outer membrane protein OmpA-like peptidoglycan-associated protein